MTETGGCCEFPFIYKMEVYQTCTMTDAEKPWCGTETFSTTWDYCKTGKNIPCIPTFRTSLQENLTF